jgi:hypothetical protein
MESKVMKSSILKPLNLEPITLGFILCDLVP